MGADHSIIKCEKCGAEGLEVICVGGRKDLFRFVRLDVINQGDRDCGHAFEKRYLINTPVFDKKSNVLHEEVENKKRAFVKSIAVTVILSLVWMVEGWVVQRRRLKLGGGRHLNLGKIGTNTSTSEVTGVSAFGVWLLHHGKEYFLGYEDFPWFLNAPIRKILAVVDEGPGHLRWPDLDIDLHVDALRDPGASPMVYEPIADDGSGNADVGGDR